MDRKYSFVVFGATGFAGRHVAATLAQYAKNYHWAVAGRNENKLFDVLSNIYKQNDQKIEAGVIASDVEHYASLTNMTSQANVILNCVGPYRFFGEPVIKACIETRTHYVDLCGEPYFLESMFDLYNQQAERNQCYIVGACGFDSIPCDIGVSFMSQRFNGTINDIETYHELIAPKGFTCNFATFQCMIHGVANRKELTDLRKALALKYDTIMPKSAYRLESRGLMSYVDDVQGWCVPFMGSDRSVVQRSQRYDYENKDKRPIQIQTYLKMSNLFSALILIGWSVVFYCLTRFRYGKQLLESYPEVLTLGYFSKKGPTNEQIKRTTFKTTLVGCGWKNRNVNKNEDPVERPVDKIFCEVSGPEPGYVSTSIMIVAAALTILEDKDRLPKKAGVYSTASVFAGTHLIDRLTNMGISFK